MLIQKNNEFVNNLCSQVKYIFTFCIYKIYLILAERYKNAGAHLRVRKTGKIWVSMMNVHKGLGVQNMSDLVLKEKYGIYKTKNLTKD